MVLEGSVPEVRDQPSAIDPPVPCCNLHHVTLFILFVVSFEIRSAKHLPAVPPIRDSQVGSVPFAAEIQEILQELKMRDEDKTREQLKTELQELREQVAEYREEREKRRKAEQALQESQQMLQLVLNTIPARVFWKDVESIYLGCNRPFALDAGVQSPEDIIGKSDFDMGWAAQAEIYRSDDRLVMETGRRKIGYEEPMTAPDGRRVWLRTSKVPLLDTEGKIKGVLGTYEDITQHKLAEEQITQLNALRERLLGREALNEKLRIITEAAVQILGADFARIWITKEGDLCERGCSHAGVEEGPHVCRDRTRCLHLMASSGRYTHLDGNHRRVPLGAYKIGNIASGKDAFFLTNDVTHDPCVHDHEWAASIGLVSFAGFRLISPDGNPIGVLALFGKQPISPEEMRFLEDLANTTSQVIRAGVAEDALKESENRFRSLVMNSSDTITVLAADGTISYQSPSLKRFFGYEPEELIGRNAFHYVHPDDLASAQAAFSQILEHPGRSLSVEYRFRHADGSWVFVESVGSSFLDDPSIKGVVLNSRDISERKLAEEALEKRIVALTQPLDAVESIAFEDLFNLADLQCLQDLFADVWGVAALITRPDGTPITQPSNFSHLCSEIIRQTEKGSRNCQLSDAMIGRHNPFGPTIQHCLSAGLCNAGASITVGGRHIANWLIGQVRNEAHSEEQMMEYAREIGADEVAFREAYRNVPIMPQEKFDRIAHALFALAKQLSTTAYQNIQQARFIAQRKKAEQALTESQQMLQLILDTIPVRVFWKDLNLNYLGCNRAFARDAGLRSPEEIVGKSDFEMIWAEYADIYRSDDRFVLQTGSPILGHQEPPRATGHGRIWLLMNRVPLLDAKGKIKGVLGTYEDITESKQMEVRLQASETKYRIVADNTYDWEYWTSPEGHFLYNSPSFQRITGYKMSDLEADPNLLSRIVHPEDLVRFEDHVSQDQARSASCDLEFRVTHLDGTTRWIGHVCHPVFDAQGVFLGRRGSNRDITERKRAEEALRDSSERLKRFAYSVAHDLKSPAIGIHGLVKRLSKSYRGVLDERGKNYCDLILRASEHIAALVDKVNAYIATKEARLSIEMVEVGEILQMLSDEFSAQLATRRVDWNKPESRIEIQADRLSMIRAFRNFLDNSLKYGGKRLTKIWTEYEETDEFHIFSFSDNGKGLRDEDSIKIFKAFQRDETSKGVEGAGLGLSIVKEIAEQHGGKVWVEPRTTRGATFCISISKNLQTM